MRTRWALRLAALLIVVLLGCSVAPAAQPSPSPSPPPPTKLRVGLASNGKTYLPMYVVAERTGQLENLDVELVTLQGGPELMQALASGSVDVGMTGLNSAVTAIAAGQPMKAFYTGLPLGDYQWFAASSIHSWDDLRGKTLGVTGTGSLIDLFSRVILRQHGLVPDQDVHFVTVGNPPTALQALQSGRVDATVLTNPTAWQAEAAGFVRLVTLGTEAADQYPQSVLVAKDATIASTEPALRRLLRAQVRADRLIQADRQVAVDALVKYVKFTTEDAARTYDDVKDQLNERGQLPSQAMPFFWQVAELNGDTDAPWPEDRFLDRRFVDSFGQWALG